MPAQQLDRRTFVKGAAGLSALGLSGAVLDGCSSSAADKNTADANRKVQLPRYIPYQGSHANLPGNARGLQQGFLRYPTHPVDAVTQKPAAGGSITAFTAIIQPPPPPRGRNDFWQELNKRIGADLKVDMAPAADYPQKFSTLIASGNLPDLVMIRGTQPELPRLLSSKFTDLSSFVARDAIKDYPFLANISTDAWRAAVYNGGIYGVPVQREATGSIMYRRDDLFTARSLNPDPQNFAEFKEICKEFTDERKNRWALAIPAGVQQFIAEMMGLPNNWSLKDGKFTRSIELDETRQAISRTAALIKAGYMRPDAFAETANPKDAFFTGTLPIIYDSYSAWSGYLSSGASFPDFDLGGMLPPDYDGSSKANIFRGPPIFSITALRKADHGRVVELLKVLNWLAAPFGTAEYLFRKYGVKDVDYTTRGSDPVVTAKGTSELSLPLLYIADAPWPIYEPGHPGNAKKEYMYAKGAIPLGVKDPTIGLFSDTQASAASEYDKALGQAQIDVLQGHKSMSAWDDAVKDWRTHVGDKIRHEYEESYAKTH